MVAEEAPCVSCPARRRVGVKRSREQPDRLAVASAEMRPALDADPARPVITPTMNTEGTGATSTSTTSGPSTRLPTRPRSLVIAAVLSAVTDDSDPAGPFNTEAGFTHRLLAQRSARRASSARRRQTAWLIRRLRARRASLPVLPSLILR